MYTFVLIVMSAFVIFLTGKLLQYGIKLIRLDPNGNYSIAIELYEDIKRTTVTLLRIKTMILLVLLTKLLRLIDVWEVVSIYLILFAVDVVIEKILIDYSLKPWISRKYPRVQRYL